MEWTLAVTGEGVAFYFDWWGGPILDNMSHISVNINITTPKQSYEYPPVYTFDNDIFKVPLEISTQIAGNSFNITGPLWRGTPVTGRFISRMSGNAGLWRFHSCKSEQNWFTETVVWPVIWDALAFMWCHRDNISLHATDNNGYFLFKLFLMRILTRAWINGLDIEAC